MNRSFIEQLITKHEGRRAKVYKDSLGILTIGIGWNLQDSESGDIAEHFGLDLIALKDGSQELTDQQIDAIFNYQLTRTISDANHLLSNFNLMPDKVQAAVVDMLFQLGLTRFSKFRDMIWALNHQDWKAAGVAARNSLWAQQTPIRALEDIDLLETA